MRIFVRNSKSKFVDSKEVFNSVKLGMKFFGELFNHPFPFDKYDIIYCPEFRITAMENVGAVTFTDRVLMPKDTMTRTVASIHIAVHMHELSHMWFGDLTTMQWWNDLWLKESFADFCKVISMTEIPEIAKSYPNSEFYNLAFLSNANEADLLPSTHPIQAVIKHTGDATSAFDAISYRKGASWIKTMNNFIGRSILQEGLRDYVNSFAYKNTVLNDLVLCLNKAYNKAVGSGA